jgi:transposase
VPRKEGWQRKTRWTSEFKLAALARMEVAADVKALAAELGCRREQLYAWRRKFLAGGAEALRMIGRPSVLTGLPVDGTPAPPSGESVAVDRKRLEALERKIGQQQLDLDFFRAALRHVRERRQRSGAPGERTSSR